MTYKEDVDILCVYIQEAHPTDGWQIPMNLDDQVIFAQPKSEQDRAEVAEACAIGLDLKMPILLDRLSNEVDTAYAALPDRLYVIDREGVIAYRSEQGPWGFDADAFEKAIRQQVE